MFVRMKLTLRDEAGRRLLPEYAYALYSDLMESIPQEYAQRLHEEAEMRPVSHFLVPDRNQPGRGEFFLSLYEEEALDAFAPVLLHKTQFELHKYGCRLNVERMERETIDLDEMTHRCFDLAEPPTSYVLHFLSPAAFRSQEEYVLYPTAELILKSAMSRFQLLGSGMDAVDQNALEQMAKRARITDYTLYSRRYRVKDTTVYGFTGWVRMTIRGPLPLRQLFRLYMTALPCTGLGLKTAMGMGGCSVEEYFPSANPK